jgi:hypothetical protein
MQGVRIRVLYEATPSYTLTLGILFFVTTDFAVDRLISVGWKKHSPETVAESATSMAESNVEQIYVWQ